MRMFAALAGLVVGFAVASSSVAAGYTAGKEYVVLPERVVPADAKKIEVAEFFPMPAHTALNLNPSCKLGQKNCPLT